MAGSGDVTQEHSRERIRDFIFARELAEVYLLLDHLSGRSDKSLAAAIGGGEDTAGNDWIEKICNIGWPPEGTSVQQAAQAATLLLAKDRLNAAAKPANGASIAFTLLVAGDDDASAARGPFAWLSGLWPSAESPPKPAPAKEGGDDPANAAAGGEPGNAAPAPAVAAGNATPATPAIPQAGGGGGNGGSKSASPPDGWGGEPPSRMSLARLAYPGFVGSAGRFNWQIKAIILLLFAWLIFTCGLSWNVAAGHAILARLDAMETARTAIQKRIAASEGTPAPAPAGAAPALAAVPTTDSSATPKPGLVRYCDRSRLLAPQKTSDGKDLPQFVDATQRQVCDELTENLYNYRNSREDLAVWLAPWEWLKWPSHKICGGDHCLQEETADKPTERKPVDNQQWAAVLVEVLATAVLPLCYGFLGAGAAVVRNIWGKMRDSLLSPRDLTLSLGQLALGAVIGACIGLFVTPSGAGSQGAVGLTGSVSLTPSALSFIAGFGVEGVFVALENLIKRVFNIPEPKP
jgi:hypothetical protein